MSFHHQSRAKKSVVKPAPVADTARYRKARVEGLPGRPASAGGSAAA